MRYEVAWQRLLHLGEAAPRSQANVLQLCLAARHLSSGRPAAVSVLAASSLKAQF